MQTLLDQKKLQRWFLLSFSLALELKLEYFKIRKDLATGTK